MGESQTTKTSAPKSRPGFGALSAATTLAGGILQLQAEQSAAAIEQRSIVRQATDAMIQRNEAFAQEVGRFSVVSAESPGSKEQISQAVAEAAGDNRVDIQIINDELRDRLDAISNRFQNRGAMLAVQTFGSFLPFA